ncbi:hypothetical protein OSB04_030316 [Centaurea solstitialis]|uniref:Auxin-responsive protein n=1 Tax=Centaurea solstitialis TaxID=347529 RepID=A0AA38S877_9ASTR|nr:hypothetical protein OSB04_030316 [Centaurea solstitialis]
MASETSKITSELTTAAADDDYSETELTLGLPGESRGTKSGRKRRFSDTFDLKLKGDGDGDESEDLEGDLSDPECSDATKPSPEKEQVVGWPPVRSYRKNVISSNFKFVKVAVDGAPYLRKVDLESYGGYQQLLYALEDIFSCFTIEIVFNERKLMDTVNRIEYIPTYEDKDGDWMLVGDVPWKMFIDTCKRIRLMRSSEAVNGLGISLHN